MTQREQVEDAIDALRRNKDIDSLQRIVTCFLHKQSKSLSAAELSELCDDVLFAVVKLVSRAIPTYSIANQLGAICNKTLAQLQRDKATERKRVVSIPDVEVLPAQDILQTDAALEVLDREAVDEILRDLLTIRESNPRYFEVLVALIDGASVADRLADKFGEAVSSDAERQLVHRARTKLDALITRRKEEVS